MIRPRRSLLFMPGSNARALVERGALHLHGAYFGVAEGSLFVLDQAAKEFRSLREDAGE